MLFHELIPVFGYAAIAVGSFIEGETTVVLGGIATYQGYLGLHWVIPCAFAGTLFGDFAYFYLGRTKGSTLLKNKIKPGSLSARILKILNKNQVLMILGFRFLYGFRTVILLALGASRIKPHRFFLLNIISCSVWVVFLCLLGYLFGHTLEIAFMKLKYYQLLFYLFPASAAFVAWLVYKRFIKDTARNSLSKSVS